MSATRIGATLQPACPRAASTIAGPGSTFGEKLQSFLVQAIAASEKAADLILALFTPVSVIALALGLWRLTTDLGWTGAFLIADGFFSHWLVWIALAIGLKAAEASLTALSAKTGVNRKTSEETGRRSDILSLDRQSRHVLPH